MHRIVTFSSCVAAASAVLGIDVSSSVSVTAAKCLKGAGYDFGVVRAWHSYGGWDSNAVPTVANLLAGGFAHVDVYMFPCRSQGAASQIATLVSDLKGNGVKNGMIWLDIETNPSTGCGWAATTDVHGAWNATAAESNCQYIGDLIAAIKANGEVPGVYASEYMWGNIAGASCTSGSVAPLWYAHYDGSPSFGDYAPFGGWAKPAIKQYDDTGSSCGVSFDQNYYP